MRNLVLFPMLILSACQTAPKSVVPATQTWEEFIRTRPSNFIQGRTEQLAAERHRLERLGLAKDYEVVRALVDTHLPPGNYTMQEPGATAAILRRHRVDSTTVSMLDFGYRGRHLAAPQQAYSLVRAAASGFGDADTLVLLSPIVLVADLTGIDRRPDNSAFLVYVVTEAIKSAPPPGTEFRILLNGPFPTISAPPGAPPPPPPPPNPGLTELSSHTRVVFYFDSIKEADGKRIGDTNFGPMPIEGQRVRPGYHSTTAETTLAAIRAAARAQACSPGYVPVVVTSGPPERC